MISSLRGTLTHKAPTELTIDVNGIGYSVVIPLSTYEAVGEVGAQISILTHLNVREDILQLFGFATSDEREVFRLLISVSGIGPKMAQTILSGIPVTELKTYVANSNFGALTRIPGVGRKLAERLVVELRDKISKLELGPPSGGPGDPHLSVRSEALLALTSLGYARPVAEKALRSALGDLNDKESSVEELIKAALRHAAK
ncbi:MAG: Holliday junction branch migration protein RuvA [Bacteroidota bacterium]